MKLKVAIIYKKLKDLIPYENNPRINEKAVDIVANSIREFGFQQPIVIDKHNVIICGHTRQLAGLKLGIEEAPCVIAKNLTDKQVKAYRLADNKVAEIAEWDFELLESEFEAIEDLGGFNMADFGFEELNTESIMDDLDDVSFNKGETTEFHLTLTFTKEENEYIESFLKDKSKVDLKNFLIEKLKGGA